MKVVKKGANIQSVELNVYNRPSFLERIGRRWIGAGYDNLFPVYLVDLYNQSNTHGAVVDGKVAYGVGRGLYPNPDKANITEVAKCMQFLKKPNPYETWEELHKKIWVDYEIHNAYAFEILCSRYGKPVEVYHIDILNLRADAENKNILLYSHNWENKYSTPEKRIPNSSPVIVELPKYDASQIQPRSVLIHYEPRPGMKHYSLPPYINALEAIQEETEISQYHLNNVMNGFVGGTMINFLNGVPSTDEQDIIEKRMSGKFTGGKAQKLVLNFADSKDNAAEVLPLQPNNLDKQFELRAKAVPENIIIGHRAVSGFLFGIKTEGQLGGRTEILEAYELFKETYVKPRQDTVLKSINKIFEIFGLSPIIEIKELKPLAERLPISEQTIAQLIPRQTLMDYVAEMYGLTLPKPIILSSQKPFYFETVGVNADDYEILESHDIHFDGEGKPVFHLKFDDDDKDRPSGFMPGTRETTKTTPTVETLVIKYRYALRPDAPALIGQSRDFCQRLMSLNKLYSKEEIEGMRNDMEFSDIVDNTDVWKYRGGWYTNPNTDASTPFCRHVWNQVLVRQKSGSV